MGLIKTVGYNAPQALKCQLCNTLVRSEVEYCTQVRAGLSKTKFNVFNIERIQKNTTRYIN